MIELCDGYVIDEMSEKKVALKQRYQGIRNGSPAECYRTLSYHSNFEDAKEAFRRLSGKVCERGEIISLTEYEKRRTAEKERKEDAAESASFMKHFHMYVPVAKGTEKQDKIDVFISFFIPGRENAIKRSDLVKKCVEAGLIAEHIKDKDRAMRRLLKEAGREYAITNDARGDGYYRPTPKEYVQLKKNNNRESKKSVSNFAGHKVNRAYEEDCKARRFEECQTGY